MAEEIDNRRQYPCPCGEGTYSVVSFANDWRSTGDSWRMDCPRCRETHRLLSFTYQKSGKNWEGKKWVTIPEWEAAKKRRADERDSLRAAQERIDGVVRKALDEDLSGAAAFGLAVGAGYGKSRSTFYRTEWKPAIRRRSRR